MRVLDLGAHDGYVSAYILEHFPHAHVDAVELHVEFAAACDQRITGTCKVGRAEEAPELFEPGTYDAVLLFELIEHVVDMDALLAAAERMLKPDGQVYVSTPNGTFGAGGNPHHLRALRAIDLAELLRRRGRLADMHVGSDGVVVARYTPHPRREDIAIYTGPGWEPWHPSDILTRGLGGSETAAVRLAEQLSALGFVVTVYGELREDTCWRDVIFRQWQKFDPLDGRACLIASRQPHVFDRPVAAPVRMLWVHDVDCGDELGPRRAEAIDHVLALSEWHERHLSGRYPFLVDPDGSGLHESKVLRIRNGIEHDLFAPIPWEDRDPTVLVTSSPDRGLDIMLELFPRIRDAVPEAKLVHCYAQVYDKIAEKDPTVAAHRRRIRELAAQPGVESVGSLSQPALAELMCRSRVWAHPSWTSAHNGPFFETSCIGAMEAQAAGCVVVASGWGALPETARTARLVNSQPGGPRWRDAIVREVIDGLTNPATGEWAVREGPRAVADLGWAPVAETLGKLVAAGVRQPAA